jgi:hypothetical protein
MKMEPSPRCAAARHGSIRSTVAAVAVALPLVVAASAACAETRGYVVSWFAIATNNPDFAENCPRAAKDPNRVKFVVVDTEVPQRDIQAVVGGKPVPSLDYPDALQKDPGIETVVGKYAYGFDLGGPAADKFVDPDTHGKVDDQLWRAIGCTSGFQATPPVLPYNETAPWGTMIDTSPAYAMQISGADLSKDGPVTVTLDRTLRHLERDASGGVRSGVSYVLDPSPRSHNVLSGEIKDGVLTINPGYIYLVGDMPFYTQIDLKNAHMRLRSETDGTIVGYWGGYTDWHAWVYTFTARPAGGADNLGIYWALKKLADADPDPATGQNRLISVTWRMEAVPAFLATNDGKVVAMSSSDGLGGKVEQPPVQQPPVQQPTEAPRPSSSAP